MASQATPMRSGRQNLWLTTESGLKLSAKYLLSTQEKGAEP
jgi:hypothetical protein